MRSIEDMLLQLILQGDSFMYHFVASHHHAAPHRVEPCCTHHHNAGPHDHVVHITLLHCCPICHNRVVIHVSCACRTMLAIVVHACHVAPFLPCCPCFPCCTMFAMLSMLHHAFHVTVVPCIYTTICTFFYHASIQHYVPCCPMHLYNTMYLDVLFTLLH